MTTRALIRRKIFASAALLTALLQAAPAVDWYVATNGTGLGTNGWANATNNLQGAINISAVNDTVWVSNGLYDTGGITNYPVGNNSILTNRIAIWKSITVRSQNNDPTNTIIKGAWHPVTTNGASAVRCVFMNSNSVLIGFTLTNGATMTTGTYDKRGGGVACPGTLAPVISNCLITGNAAQGDNGSPYTGGGGAYWGTLVNCTLSNNSAVYEGGGANWSTISNCTLIGNTSGLNGGGLSRSTNAYNCMLTGNRSSALGGGIYDCYRVINCTLVSNRSGTDGGGVNYGTLSNCTLVGNFAANGGGVANSCTLYSCLVVSNTVTGNGGGAYNCSLYNCILIGNSVGATGGGGGAIGNADLKSYLYNCLVIGNKAYRGGGTADSYINNCTIVGNEATIEGGGVYGANNWGILNNCIVYFNKSGDANSNYFGPVASKWTNTCTAPAVAGWMARNITSDPLLVNKGSGYGTNHVSGNYRLTARSPCVNAGTNFTWMTGANIISRDLDNMPRLRYGTVDMGAYENIRGGTIYGFR